MAHSINTAVAGRLDELARLLTDHGANPFRIAAYRRAAGALRELEQPVDDIVRGEGVGGLEAALGIGSSLAGAIHDLVMRGRLPLLDRLRGEADPVATLASVPGIGPVMADRLHHDVGISGLEDLEAAAWDGRLARLGGFGKKRLAGIRDALATRLGRIRPAGPPAPANAPPVAELLDVDAEYRDKAAQGRLRRITPRRFNPGHEAWLPILHTVRGDRHYTAVFSNTPRAQRLAKTHDWVVLFCDGRTAEGQYTVVTAQTGPLHGSRVIRGREAECEVYYRGRPAFRAG
jgi:putative hydrolase